MGSIILAKGLCLCHYDSEHSLLCLIHFKVEKSSVLQLTAYNHSLFVS